MKTFAEALCTRFNCRRKDYLRIALTRTLYPQARLLVWPYLLFGSAQTLSVLEAAAEVTDREELQDLLREYAYHIALDHGSLTNKWKLRVSGKRLQKLFNEVMCEPAVVAHEEVADVPVPFMASRA